MSEAIEIDQFVAETVLPDGFRFKEWQPDCFLELKPENVGQYLNTALFAIEKISDGALSTFELSYLHLGNIKDKDFQLGKQMVRRVDMEIAVAKAIAELKG